MQRTFESAGGTAPAGPTPQAGAAAGLAARAIENDEALTALPASLLQVELGRIVESAAFRNSPRHRRFLEYLVAQAMLGDGLRVKEITLGIDVFDRHASNFDPQRDTIVRVEARRLRSRLARYYREDGATSLIEIALPVGSYTPVVHRRVEGRSEASLAVIPLVDRSGAPLGPALCDDLHDALLDAVARVPGFKVIARTSAQRLANGHGAHGDDDGADDAGIAGRLGVALLLRGRLDQDGRSLRLKLRLARGDGGGQPWNGVWTLDADGDFAARDALVARVVDDVQRALAQRLPRLAVGAPAPAHGDAASAEAASHGSRTAIDERARELVDRGRYLMRHGNVDDFHQALQRFRSAVEIAPGYAAAHFGIARTLSHLLGMTLVAPDDGIDEAKRAALDALALDPAHGDAAALLASLQQRFDHDWPTAQAGYLAAIARSPGSLYVHVTYAFGLMFSGRFDEAEAELHLARELDPLDIGLRAFHALIHIYRRDYPRAEAVLGSVIDDQPGHLLARSLLGWLHLLRGRPDQALVEYGLVRDLPPALSIGPVGIAQALALAGRVREAEAAREALIRRFEGRYLSPYQLALIAVRLGDHDEAFAQLARAATGRDPNFISVLVDPSLDALRGDERYVGLLRTCGLDGVMPGVA